MNTWVLIKEILHGAGFYWKKFVVLSLVLVVVVASWAIFQTRGRSQAEFQFSNEAQFSMIDTRQAQVVVGSNGLVTIDGKKTDSLYIQPDYYEVRMVVLDKPGEYIGKMVVTMTLPKPVQKNQISQIVYAIHGIGSYQTYMTSPTTLVYEATDISSESTLSISAHLPKNSLTPPLSKRVLYYITNVPAKVYAGIAITIPLITLMIMLTMVVRRRRDQIVSLNVAPSEVLPEGNIPPAVAGVLLDGQVGPREIAATLIDLANRGYLFITQDNGYFTFGKRKSLDLANLPELRLYERILLSKIFTSKNYKSTKEDVEMRVGNHIFSRKIAQVFLEIYNEATRLGYFVQNPAVIHRRWKYTGIVLFFLGALGFAHNAIFAPDPKFTLIFWVGEMAAAWVIIKISGLMPVRSAAGSRALTGWMAFRRYLKLEQPIEAGANINETFNNYLPYAIVFGVEADWAKRFLQTSFVLPTWFESFNQVNSLEDYIGGLYPIISFSSQILANAHDPTVE